MSPELQRIREDYLSRLSSALAGVTPDVAAETRREIAAHIDDALAAREERSVGAMLDVLERLGPPESYARDVALYMMVDLGYRRWSPRHMLGSARFWAVSTVAGSVVVVIFGLLYLIAFGSLAIGIQHLVADVRPGPPPLGRLLLPQVPAIALLAGGVLAILAVTGLLRWFIGQYVRHARPSPGTDDRAEWVGRTSRRIVVLAIVGLVVALGGGLASGGLRLGDLGTGPDGQIFVAAIRSVSLQRPAAIVGMVGLLVFFLAPVIGLMVTVLWRHRDGGLTAGR